MSGGALLVAIRVLAELSLDGGRRSYIDDAEQHLSSSRLAGDKGDVSASLLEGRFAADGPSQPAKGGERAGNARDCRKASRLRTTIFTNSTHLASDSVANLQNNKCFRTVCPPIVLPSFLIDVHGRRGAVAQRQCRVCHMCVEPPARCYPQTNCDEFQLARAGNRWHAQIGIH